MRWFKRHFTLKRQIKAQGLNLPGKSYVQQMTALYESRIREALAKPQAGERLQALKNLQEDMQGHLQENNRILQKKAEMEAAGNKGFPLLGTLTLFGITLATTALAWATGGLSTLLSEFAFGMAGVGNLIAFTGVLTLSSGDSKGPDHIKNLVASEAAALTRLSEKAGKEMETAAYQAKTAEALQFIRNTALETLDDVKTGVLNAFKAAVEKTSGTTGDLLPKENQPGLKA